MLASGTPSGPTGKFQTCHSGHDSYGHYPDGPLPLTVCAATRRAHNPPRPGLPKVCRLSNLQNEPSTAPTLGRCVAQTSLLRAPTDTSCYTMDASNRIEEQHIFSQVRSELCADRAVRVGSRNAAV